MKKFEEFCKSTKDNFFGYLIKLTGNYDDASDTLQESYARMIEKHYKTPTKPLLYKIGYNLFIDSKRKQRGELAFDNVLIHEKSKENLTEAMLTHEKYEAVIKILQTFTAEERNIISLKVNGMLSYKEIAKNINSTENNIKVKVHRIRKKIKEKMRKEGLL